MKTSISLFIAIVMAISLQSCHRAEYLMNDNDYLTTLNEKADISRYSREQADSTGGDDEPRKDRQQWRPIKANDQP